MNTCISRIYCLEVVRPHWSSLSWTSPQSSSMNRRLRSVSYYILLTLGILNGIHSTLSLSPAFTSKSNFDLVLQWVSMSDFVGQPPTKKEVQANFKTSNIMPCSCSHVLRIRIFQPLKKVFSALVSITCVQDWLETEGNLHRGCTSYVAERAKRNKGSRPGQVDFSKLLVNMQYFNH